ncbi:energy transducer TonB [Paraburkholderia sp. J12]|uniref:energy transducer TonB n=1 Tax=Paraburkholderia sp. J12 TaxID=2805432 RepID=UPI002ABE94E6|nr:energy transducer TonB [Paraburkholderia sp. J12]
MKIRYTAFVPVLALGLASYAPVGHCSSDIASLAGVYSSAHPVTIDGVRTLTHGYVEIDRDGRITAFEQDGEGPGSIGSGCYRMADGTATNAGLQQRILTPGVSPRGDAVYQTLAGESDTFGILVKPGTNGAMQWFFHWGAANSTVTINGNTNVVSSQQGASYSISGPALATPTPEQLRGMLCHPATPDLPHTDSGQAGPVQESHADAVLAAQNVAAAASGPVAAGIVHQPSLPASGGMDPSSLAPGLPFVIAKDVTKPIDATALAKFGVSPDSPQERILKDWAQKVVSDSDIKGYFLAAPDPASGPAVGLSRALGLMDGMARISPQDREQLAGMTTRALENAPPDCGGARSVQAITSRYLSLGSESDELLEAQLQAIFDLLKQSTQTAPPPQITAAQQLQGQLALSSSIAEALKHDPSEADDLGLLLTGKQAMLSPEAWCKATRLYQAALTKVPQPQRDWIMLADLEKQRRLASVFVAVMTRAASMPRTSPQASGAPVVFDYAERVRQRVRPLIVWSGKAIHGETVVEVHCKSSGNLESARIVRSSGDKEWDSAALSAVRRADPMPVDENGEAPRTFEITLRPGI